MKEEPFVIETIYKASVETVWKAITNSNDMKQWHFDVPGFRAEPGFEFHFSSSPGEDRFYRHTCQVTEVKLYSKLSFTWQYNRYEAITLVTFEMMEMSDGATRLRLTHRGLEAFPDTDPDFSRDSFAEGWTWIVNTAFKEYLEGAHKPAGRKVKMVLTQ